LPRSGATASIAERCTGPVGGADRVAGEPQGGHRLGTRPFRGHRQSPLRECIVGLDVRNTRSMATRGGRAGRTRDGYWQKRVRTTAFKRKLSALVSGQLDHLGRTKVESLVDAVAVRRAIRQWKIGTAQRRAFAEALIAAGRRLQGELKRQRRSLRDVLGPDLASDVESILEAETSLPPNVEKFAADLMEQEFVRRLLTDLVFTAIATFYRRVNPLFGAVTTHMLEDQIKGFIGLFMPTLQRQAMAFVISRANQRAALDLGRAIVRQLLAEPLSRHADVLSSGSRRQAEALLRKVLHTGTFDATIRRVVVVAWEDLYARVRTKTIAELIDLRQPTDWAAERIPDALATLLARPDVARLIADEMTLARHLE